MINIIALADLSSDDWSFIIGFSGMILFLLSIPFFCAYISEIVYEKWDAETTIEKGVRTFVRFLLFPVWIVGSWTDGPMPEKEKKEINIDGKTYVEKD